MFKEKIYHHPLILLVLSLLAIMGATPCGATPLNLTLNSYPDIYSSFIATQYDAGADTFLANGFALTLADGVGTETITNGVFSLNANIDESGDLLSGNLTIEGEIASLGFTSGTLLVGNLTDFGFAGTDDPFEFMFDVIGGDAKGLFGDTGGLLLHCTSFTGNFNENWGDDFGLAVSDTGVPTPEPCTLALLGTGLIGLVRMKRKKQ